jgi:hypothetical protein
MEITFGGARIQIVIKQMVINTKKGEKICGMNIQFQQISTSKKK